MTIVSGIAGVLLGLLFGWLWGRPRGTGSLIQRVARFYDWQEPDADQSAIIRSGCTCDTSCTEPCWFHDGSTHIAPVADSAQRYYTR